MWTDGRFGIEPVKCMGTSGIGCGLETDPLKDCAVVNHKGLATPIYCVVQQPLRFICSYPSKKKF